MLGKSGAGADNAQIEAAPGTIEPDAANDAGRESHDHTGMQARPCHEALKGEIARQPVGHQRPGIGIAQVVVQDEDAGIEEGEVEHERVDHFGGAEADLEIARHRAGE